MPRTGRRPGEGISGQISEDDLLQVHVGDAPTSVVHVAVGAHENARLAFGAARLHDVVEPLDVADVAPRPGEQPVRGDDSSTVPVSTTRAWDRITR
ncbi:MAG TPA: hypothetical protein VKV27_09825 [Solirubrobacteraceae bacterium]|nr:hypothetical protein [Solirubrobacteraceae bacterium]